MRRLLDELTDEWQTLLGIAGRLHRDAEPPRAMLESARRACKRLAEQGRAELDYIDDQGGLWSNICEKKGYEPDARPAHPGWRLAIRHKEGEADPETLSRKPSA